MANSGSFLNHLAMFGDKCNSYYLPHLNMDSYSIRRKDIKKTAFVKKKDHLAVRYSSNFFLGKSVQSERIVSVVVYILNSNLTYFFYKILER